MTLLDTLVVESETTTATIPLLVDDSDILKDKDKGGKEKDAKEKDTKEKDAKEAKDAKEKDEKDKKEEGEKEKAKKEEPNFEMLSNPARVMKPQLRVVELGEEDAARYKPLKVRNRTTDRRI